MGDLRTLLHTHYEAVQGFLATARALPPEQWGRPRAEGKWSPGQVAEHIALAYEASGELLRERAPVAGAPRLLRPVLRTFLLKPVLWLGRFPAASKAPAELAPGASPAAAPVLLDRLQAAAASFESDAGAARQNTVEHPAFGRLPLVDFVRLMEIHTKHHHQQLPSGAA